MRLLLRFQREIRKMRRYHSVSKIVYLVPEWKTPIFSVRYEIISRKNPRKTRRCYDNIRPGKPKLTSLLEHGTNRQFSVR